MIERPVLCRPFIGRREELAYLRERRLEAGSSRGALLLVAGDAGVGKSRLISEFCASLAYSRWQIAHGPCFEYTNRPYGPILTALAHIDPLPLELGATASKAERFDALIERLAALSARKALVLVVEDVHWADSATLDFLTYAGTKIGRMRVMLLASFRPDDLHSEHPATTALAKIARNACAGRIDLAPLSGVELRTFIDEALSGTELPAETRRAIAVAGEGNPFFTEELLKSAVEDGSNRGTPERRRLPQNLRVMLRERLRPFDETGRRILTQAAVVGRSFPLALLATTLDMEAVDVLPTLRRARDFQIVEEVGPDAFRFRHGLTRDAMYAEFLGAEARPLHRAIALALENEPAERRSLEALAYHWWAAGDERNAARYSELAGDAAAAVHAHEDAIALYERVLDLAQVGIVERAAIMEKIADARAALSMYEESIVALRGAADLFCEARLYDREATCRAREALALYTLGLPAPTAPLDMMLARLAPEHVLASARLHLGYAWIDATLCFPTRAQAHLAEVDARALEAAPDVRMRFHNISAWVAMTFGDVERFRREHDSWIAVARSISSAALASAYTNGAICYVAFALHEEALHCIDRAFTVAKESRNRHNEWGAHAILGVCYLQMGELNRSRAAIESIPTTTENKVTAAFASACGTSLAAHFDDDGFTEKWFDGFVDAVTQSPEIESGGPFAEMLVRRGRHAEASALLQRAIPDCEIIRGNVETLLAVAKYGGNADRTRARAHLARGAESPHDVVERPGLALFDAIGARDARPAEAAALAAAAAEGFQRLRLPLLEAQGRELAGDLESALAIYRRCGATFDVRRLEGARPTILSAREREVAELAARGTANLEIARRLAIHHKTVEKHLASAYLKLGISSRRELSSSLDIR